MMMVRLLLGTLLIVGCAVGGEEEQNTAGVLSVDSNSNEVEVPDWVTAAYLDLNKDSTIDIKDLVIMSKFFGQDVPEADAVAEGSEETDDSSPCGDMEHRYAQFDDITVTDNISYRQIFDIKEKKYVYALLGMIKIGSSSGPEHQALSEEEKAEYSKDVKEIDKAGHKRPSCVAIRFLLDENLLPVTMKIKTIDGFNYPQTISPSSLKIDARKIPYCNPKISGSYCDRVYLNDEGLYMSGGNWSVEVLRNFNFSTSIEGDSSGRWARHYKRHKQVGIPIGNDSVITRLFLKLYEEPSKYSYMSSIYYGWKLWNGPNSTPFASFFDVRDVDHGLYVKMSPTEVQRRYFPEDIQ